MMIEKSGTIRLRDIPTAAGLSPKEQELAAGMVRVTHLYRSALKVAVTQMEILDEEFARLYDHSPIHHIEYRIKTLDSIIDKLRRRGLEVMPTSRTWPASASSATIWMISTTCAPCSPAASPIPSSARWTISRSPRTPVTAACT